MAMISASFSFGQTQFAAIRRLFRRDASTSAFRRATSGDLRPILRGLCVTHWCCDYLWVKPQ